MINDRYTEYVDVLVNLALEGQRPIDWTICECQGCHNDFIAQKLNTATEWTAVWPLRVPVVPSEIPQEVQGPYREAQLCEAVGARLSALMMCRTALIRLLRDRAVSSFKELNEAGTISGALWAQADEVRLWANAIAHEDVDDEAVTAESVRELLGYLDALLSQIYVQPVRLKMLQADRAGLSRKAAGPQG